MTGYQSKRAAAQDRMITDLDKANAAWGQANLVNGPYILAQPVQERVGRVKVLMDALIEIAYAGMSSPPDMSEDARTAWHARQAWKFIGIAARAIDQEPTPAPVPVQKDSCFCHDGASLQTVSGGAAPEGYLGKVTLLIDGEYVDYVKAQPAQEPVCPACKAGVLYKCVACSSNNYPPQEKNK